MAEIIIRGPEQKFKKQSFGQVILDNLKNGGSRIALVDAESDEKMLYNQLLQRSLSLAEYFKQINLNKNDTISICSANSLYFPIPILSAFYLGITVAPLNHLYTERELIHALEISKPKILFCTSNVLDKILNVAKHLKIIKQIIVMNQCTKVPKSVLKLQDLFNFPILKDEFEVTLVDPDHTAAILYSSGTTGLPKGVMLTHQNFNSVLNYLQHPGYGNYNSSRVYFGIIPYFHGFGFSSLLCALVSNMKMIILSKFDEELFLASIEKYRVTYIPSAPPILLFLSKSPLVDKYRLDSLKEISCGAAPLGKDIFDAVTKRLNIIVRQGYGLTETTLAVIIQRYVGCKPGSVGFLVPGIEAKVIDVKTGKSLRPNQIGEVCLRGLCVMKGYAGNPEATKETLKNGWLHTGDAGYYDDNEEFYIIDRYKELIKYKGFQVPPAELEAILLKHPEIIDCAVIGKPDEKAGELPIAFVVKRPNSNLLEKNVYDFVAKNVSYHKRLHGGVKFVNSIPKNPSGKILRRVLRDQLKIPANKL